MSSKKKKKGFQPAKNEPVKKPEIKSESKPLKKETLPSNEAAVLPLPEPVMKKKAPLKQKKINKKEIFSNKTVKMWCAVGAAVVLAVAGLVFIFSAGSSVPESATPNYFGRLESADNLRELTISSSEQKEKVNAMKGVRGNKKAFVFFANTEFTAEEYNDNLSLMLGNVSENNCILTATLLNENDEIMYRSLGVEPGYYAKNMKLFKEVPYGEYKWRLVVAAYDKESYELLGSQQVKVKIKIGSETPPNTEGSSKNEES